MGVTIRGWDEFERGIRKLLDNIKTPKKFFSDAKLIMFRNVMDHFAQEEGPGGKWESLKEATLKARFNQTQWGKSIYKKGRGGKITMTSGATKFFGLAKILQDKGHLRESISMKSSSGGAEVGTNLEYAATHNYGDESRGIPQRRFLWLSEAAHESIMDRYMVHLAEGMGAK